MPRFLIPLNRLVRLMTPWNRVSRASNVAWSSTAFGEVADHPQREKGVTGGWQNDCFNQLANRGGRAEQLGNSADDSQTLTVPFAEVAGRCPGLFQTGHDLHPYRYPAEIDDPVQTGAAFVATSSPISDAISGLLSTWPEDILKDYNEQVSKAGGKLREIRTGNDDLAVVQETQRICEAIFGGQLMGDPIGSTPPGGGHLRSPVCTPKPRPPGSSPRRRKTPAAPRRWPPASRSPPQSCCPRWYPPGDPPST